MKKLTSTILLLALFLCSCSAQKQHSESVSVYTTDYINGYRSSPVCITLKPLNSTYDLYFDWGGMGAIGTYYQKGDKLYLTPKYAYFEEVAEIGTEISIFSIPMIFRKKRNKLIDITEYEKYPGFEEHTNNSIVIYKQVR